MGYSGFYFLYKSANQIKNIIGVKNTINPINYVTYNNDYVNYSIIF